MAVNGTTLNSITSYKFKHTSIFMVIHVQLIVK